MPALRRFRVEKLIRDRLPQIMRAAGLSVFERTLNAEEYLAALRDKLVEEAQEGAAARDREDVRYELGDVLEVVRALAQAQGITMEEVEAARLDKRARRGGFEGAIYNEAIEAPEGTEALSYYTERPDHYPEVRPAKRA
jgi:predicted house-cleaning noncanonical NTP pyrophosphatase (MazG superfamily)